MMTNTELFQQLPEHEDKRFAAHLERLIPHFTDDDFAVAGSFAIKYHMISHGLNYPFAHEKDLDLVIKEVSTLRPSVTEDLLISHYHPPKETYYFIIKTVDPVSHTYTHLFPYFPSSPENFINVDFNGRPFHVVGLEDQLIKTVLDTQRLSDKDHVDPKHFMELDMLLQIADMEKAENLWQAKIYQYYPYSIYDGIKKARTTASNHPQWVEENPFKNEPLAHCEECVETPGFPIASEEEVKKALGI